MKLTSLKSMLFSVAILSSFSVYSMMEGASQALSQFDVSNLDLLERNMREGNDEMKSQAITTFFTILLGEEPGAHAAKDMLVHHPVMSMFFRLLEEQNSLIKEEDLKRLIDVKWKKNIANSILQASKGNVSLFKSLLKSFANSQKSSMHMVNAVLWYGALLIPDWINREDSENLVELFDKFKNNNNNVFKAILRVIHNLMTGNRDEEFKKFFFDMKDKTEFFMEIANVMNVSHEDEKFSENYELFFSVLGICNNFLLDNQNVSEKIELMLQPMSDVFKSAAVLFSKSKDYSLLDSTMSYMQFFLITTKYIIKDRKIELRINESNIKNFFIDMCQQKDGNYQYSTLILKRACIVICSWMEAEDIGGLYDNIFNVMSDLQGHPDPELAQIAQFNCLFFKELNESK